MAREHEYVVRQTLKQALRTIIIALCLTAPFIQANAADSEADPAAPVVQPAAPIQHAAATPSTAKERLVLMPLRLGDEDKNKQAAMETALVQGLQKSYIVFSGEQVSQKAREIFLKESRNETKHECDETRCMQDIAGAFQAELIATASVSKQADGYFLALSIQNIFDNKVVFSNSVPCPNCNAYQVVDKLKELSGMEITTPASEEAPVPKGRFNLHIGTELLTDKNSYTNVFNNKSVTAKSTDLVLGLTADIGEKSALKIRVATGSGTHNLYSPATDQAVKDTRVDISFGSSFSGDRDAGWKYFVGYKTGTKKSNAIGQTWNTDTFASTGVMGGVDFCKPAFGGTIDFSLEVDAMTAKWTNDQGYNAQSNRAFGSKWMLGYAYNFTRNFAGSLSLAQQQINYDFSTFKVGQVNNALALNLLFNF